MANTKIQTKNKGGGDNQIFRDKRETFQQTGEQGESIRGLYQVFDLFSRNKKQIQILFIKIVIQGMKEEFNRVFDHFLSLREQTGDLIREKYQKINEINGELNRTEAEISLVQNIIENPQSILNVKEEEVGFQKYVTRKERRVLEQREIVEQRHLEEI